MWFWLMESIESNQIDLQFAVMNHLMIMFSIRVNYVLSISLCFYSLISTTTIEDRLSYNNMASTE